MLGCFLLEFDRGGWKGFSVEKLPGVKFVHIITCHVTEADRTSRIFLNALNS